MGDSSLRDDLHLLDPAAGIGSGPLDERARADRARILAENPGRQPTEARLAQHAPRLTSRRALTLAASVVVAAGAVVALGVFPSTGGGVAFAATPPVLSPSLAPGTDPQVALERLAATAAASKDAPGDAAVKLRMENWSLFTRVAGRTVHSVVEPQIRETTRNVDESGSVRNTIGDGAGDQPMRSGEVLSEETYGPGNFPAMYPLDLSAEPALMLDPLKVGHPIDEIGTAELFVAIEDLYREQNPNAGERAALLRLLADRQDVVTLGRMADRAGRTGTALAVDSDYSGLPTRYVLVFDDRDGRLLAGEDILTMTPGKLNVPIPAVISYELWAR